ncbi:putative leucine-rich repeat domain superfamily, F-box-like domain superfamily [Helianthus annuus]|uniref:Leucine-rich repeat domain superfamily, F-box-like domain superfamily n=1 Tax=Helianthus annuus TaxID=4232 RepID=A0A251V3B2_HELAN|nr:F-box/LRR-repeat protein At4g29420 [Helianthus annuus]KAF5812547.1 putative leucine-rich repeat domain superfamily, F-box-like domain superfamily [Helianthus annuus]KAJ0495709.1 putative leucine-rich repeat domain superfamily, F-box-like domain superfamily [Helianthus annuus]KAJ0591483.1 putative F-box protein AUF1 [Helianthus annuus]KAJ0606378.1 putative F-box protein AUF1 [Helianthus annuus]KAJ0766469.1 putative F-box protein AUF1 [Helianthus annuus]
MDKLPESLLLEILSRLDHSADVARCRFASKAFNTVFPDLRSINLQCSSRKFSSSSKKVFLDLISKQRIVESVSIRLHETVNEDFAKEWLPRVSQSLKSLSLSGCWYRFAPPLALISACCHNLTRLNLSFAWLSMDYLNPNPMPNLTSLTVEHTLLEDEDLNQLNKCFPNLQVLNLVGVGLKDPKIHLLKLQTCHLEIVTDPSSLSLITPNLIKLTIKCRPYLAAIHVDAPMLSHFHLSLDIPKHVTTLTAKFETLKTLWLDSFYIGSLLSEFPITKTVQNLTLDSGKNAPTNAGDSKLTLRKVFTVFPNLSSLCVKSSAWSELEAFLNPEGWEILDGRIELKTICAYLKLVDPSLTFSYVACVLDQCVGLSLVSLLIHADVVDTESKSFMSKCMVRWPGLKWRWGVW